VAKNRTGLANNQKTGDDFRSFWLGVWPTSAGASVGPSPILFDQAAFSRASSRDEYARESAAPGHALRGSVMGQEDDKR